MRPIKISHRFSLISHECGQKWLVPKSRCFVTLFPTKIVIEHENFNREILLPLTGIVKDYTIVLDLEKQQIRMFGFYHQGYRLFVFKADETSIHFYCKSDKKLLDFSIKHQYLPLEKTLPKLFLGITKKSDTCLMRHRKDPKEIIPLLFYYSHLFEEKWKATPLQIEALHDKNRSFTELLKIYLAFFTPSFALRQKDEEYQGITDNVLDDPFTLFPTLKEGISSLFLGWEKGVLTLLPALPKECAIGRITHFKQEDLVVSMIWKGRRVIRLTIMAHNARTITIQSANRSFRYNKKMHAIGEPLFLEKGLHYFDRFLK